MTTPVRSRYEKDSLLHASLQQWLNDGGTEKLAALSAYDIAQFCERIRIADCGTPTGSSGTCDSAG